MFTLTEMIFHAYRSRHAHARKENGFSPSHRCRDNAETLVCPEFTAVDGTPSRKTAMPAVLAILLFLLTAQAAVFATPARAGLLDKLTWKAEKHIGKGTVAEMRRTYGFVEDPILQNYVNDIGQSLAAVSHRTDIPYEFHIVDTDEVNAFAAPGGFVFVTRGMMEKVDSDDELAAVMGHEVGHVAANHGKKRVKQMPLLIAGSILLNNNTSEAAGRIIGTAFSLMQLHYSREDEYQADHLGAEYAFDASYDPEQMITMFHKLEREHPSGNLDKMDVAMQSHPKTPNRIAAFSRTAQMEKTPENLLHIANSYENRYHYREAIDRYKQILDIDPENEKAALGAARSFAALDLKDDASEWYNYALDIDPGNDEAVAGLERLDSDTSDDTGTIAELPAATEKDIDGTVAWLDRVIPEISATAINGRNQQLDIADRRAGIERSFYKNLRGYSETAKEVSSYDEYRVSVLNNAGLFFSGMFNTLAELESDGARLSETTREAERNAREMRYYLQNKSALGSDAIWAAEDLAYVAENLTTESPRIQSALDEAIDETQAGFVNTHNSLAQLGETFDVDNRHALFMVATEMNESIKTGIDHLDSAARKAKIARETLQEQRLRLKRAVLNFNAAMLTTAEENVFAKMMQRRFGMSGELIAKLKASGLGYADMVLLAGRSRRTGLKPLELLEDYDPEKMYIDDFLIKQQDAEGTAGADSLLLHFASNDLLSITQQGALLNLEPEPDPPAADVIAAYIDSADDMLVRAAHSIDEGNAREAVDIITERGKSEPATALSHLLLGLAQRNIGEDYEAALDNFKHAVDKHNESVYGHLLLANTFANLERYEDALNEYVSALQYSPDNPVVLASKAYSDAMSGNLDQAIAVYEGLLNKYEYSHVGIYVNLGLLYYEKGMLQESIDMLSKAAKLAPDDERMARMAERLKAT